MNENEIGGTPNPLEPTPPAEPVVPMEPTEAEQPVEPAKPIAPVGPVLEEQMVEQVTMVEPVEPVKPVQPAEPMAPVQPVEPEPKGSIVEPKKKSSKKLTLVLAIIFFLIAIGCGVAAIVILKPFGGGNNDAVPVAVANLIANPPKNVKIDGTITLSDSSDASVAKNLTVDFTSNLNTQTGEGVANATLTATTADDKELSFEAEEINTKDGALYMKLSGIADILETYQNSSEDEEPGDSTCDPETDDDCEPAVQEEVEEETNCITDETGATNCETIMVGPTLLDYIGLFDVIDDEWVLIQNSDFSNIIATTQVSATSQCLIDAASDLANYEDDFTTIYQNNPFITYSTDNLKVSKKKNTLYKIAIDSDELAGFVNAMSTSGFVNDLYACMGYQATNLDVQASDLDAIVALLPELYVEIDDENNFTRVYTTMTMGDLAVTADLSLSYPTESVVIEEPTDYIDVSEVLNQAYSQLYGGNVWTEQLLTF